MSDLEVRLRDTLSRRLDAVAADPARAAQTVRRARRGRAARGIAAGLAGVLVAGAAALAFESGLDERPSPAKEPPAAGTFAVSFPGDSRGTVTVDVPKAQVCLDLAGGVPVWAAHLHHDPEGLSPDPGVAEFRLSFETYRRPQCVSVDRADAERIVAEPQRHYLDAHRDHSTPVSTLRPLDLAPEELPDVAEIVCSEEGAVAVTPRVQPQEDGVHLRFRASGDRWRAFNLFNGEGANEGGDIRPGFENVSTFPPGPLYAGCFEDLDDGFSPGDPEYAELTIEDPRGLWTELDLVCGAGYEDREVETDEPSDRYDSRTPRDVATTPSDTSFPEMAREYVSGIREDDDVLRPGYPQTTLHFEHHNVFRDDAPVARLMFVDGPEVWKIRVSACPGSGIGGA